MTSAGFEALLLLTSMAWTMAMPIDEPTLRTSE